MDDLVRQLNNYAYLENCVNNMINNVNYAINELEEAKNQIKGAYNVDDESADANKIEDCYNRLVRQKQYLESTCKNAISNSKNSLNRSIKELEAEEMQLQG